MAYKKGHAGYWKGKERSLETKQKIGKAFKGKTYEEIMGKEKAEIRKKESSERMLGKGNPFYDKKHNVETKEAMSSLKIGKTHEEIMGKENAEKWHEKMSGENSPMWKGGYSIKDYKKFTNLFRNAVRKRDNNVCMMCGKHREKMKTALSVHHIDYNKGNTTPQNCISLCFECHPKTNFNRVDWVSFFQNKLSRLYNYNYNYQNNEEIIINGKYN